MGGPLQHPSIPGPLVLAAIFLVVATFLIMARTLIRATGRFLARAFRPVFRMIGTVRPDRPVQVGVAPYKALLHLLDLNSLARTELGDVPPGLSDLVERKGRLFRYVNANRAAEKLDESLSPDVADANLASATKFYDKAVEYEINPTVLYEDSEEALIIGMLRDLDLAFFYVMRRISRNVSRNVVKVISLMTALVVVFPFALSVVVEWFGPPDVKGNALLYVVVCAAFLGFLWLARFTYSISARNNGQQFNYFAQTYFSRLLNQYKSAQTAFSNVLNDRTSGLDEIEHNSNLWFMNMHWLSARQWFLELYVRNMRFQIGRNWLWTVALVPVALFGAVLVIYIVLSGATDTIAGFFKNTLGVNVSTTGFGIDHSIWTFVPSLLLLLVYGFALTNLLKRFGDEITPGGWPGFGTMDIKEVIEHNVGLIAREIVDRRRNPYGRGAPQV